VARINDSPAGRLEVILVLEAELAAEVWGSSPAQVT
jgi:hypothetical protein